MNAPVVNTPEATIILPTTGERHTLAEIALWSVSRQTLNSWELFIIGDGVAPASRDFFCRLASDDSRIRFFDHPKSPRRGEDYRHQAISEQARGKIITYLCDRDLYLPKHLEVLSGVLKSHDFAHTLPVTVTAEDDTKTYFEAAIYDPEQRLRMAIPLGTGFGLPLSTFAHTRDAYVRLEKGWETTPPGTFTDVFFTGKFLLNPKCSCYSLLTPSVIYLPREGHPGWPVEKRLGEMLRWKAKLEQPGFYERYLEQVLAFVMETKIQRCTRSFRSEITKRLEITHHLCGWKGGWINRMKSLLAGLFLSFLDPESLRKS